MIYYREYSLLSLCMNTIIRTRMSTIPSAEDSLSLSPQNKVCMKCVHQKKNRRINSWLVAEGKRRTTNSATTIQVRLRNATTITWIHIFPFFFFLFPLFCYFLEVTTIKRNKSFASQSQIEKPKPKYINRRTEWIWQEIYNWAVITHASRTHTPKKKSVWATGVDWCCCVAPLHW